MERSRWSPTAAHHRAVVVGLGLVALAVVTGRADLLVLGTPLAVVAVWAAAVRPRAEPHATAPVTSVTLHEGETVAWEVRVSPVPGLRTVIGGHPPDRWLELEPESGSLARAAVPGEETIVDVALAPTRWGRRQLGVPEVAGFSAWNAWRWGPVALPQMGVTVLPVTAPFDAQAPAPHPQGLVGMNRSARPGDGSEFQTIRPFQAGDRLRRINWRVSTRTGALHVTSTYADEDAQVVLLVDALNDIGVSTGVAREPSSMDVTVRAAAAVAEHHLRRGDRVGLRVFGALQADRVPAAAGRAHLRRILDHLALIRPGSHRADDTLATRQGLSAGTLVIMLSPLVDPVALRQAVALARHGLTVVVVDTLPAGAEATVVEEEGESRDRMRLAWRIRMLERRLEIERITALGVPVVPWAGPGSLDTVLRDLARRARAPRLVRR